MKRPRPEDVERKTAITRIWIGLAQDASLLAGGGPGSEGEAPERRAALDRVMAWMVPFLGQHGLEAEAGRDGALRTLDFATEADCLEAHERLVAANELQRDFRFHVVLRPSGVTILVVS